MRGEDDDDNDDNDDDDTEQVMVTEYTDDILELIVNQYMRPDQVCEQLGLCP